MINVEEGVQLLLEQIKPQTKTIEVELLDSIGWVLSDAVYAPFSVPHFPKSGMDGYAIRSEDSVSATADHPIRLQVVGEVLAGDDKEYQAKELTAVRIMTGGEVPQGYDCVIKQEETDYGEETVQIFKELKPYENYCKIGEDIAKGEKIIEKHTRLSCSHIGVLASMGITKVRVLAPLKVGIIATGSEIIKPGDPLGPAKVYSSSSYNIAGFLQCQGVDVKFIHICKDEQSIMADMIKNEIEKVDLLITTGAVSVGKKDIIPEVLEGVGAKILFQRVNMKPGTPVLSSVYQDKVILSFSGNPFASFINFQVFFWPILAKYLNNNSFLLKKAKAVVKEGFLKNTKLKRYVRAFEENGEVSLISKKHYSSVLSNILDCNCILIQEEGNEIKEGEVVDILYIKGSMSFI